ncbi:hypothetical protein AAC387_Pa03g4045 [Persea americana]
METELGPYELSQTPTSTKMSCADISSWLENDDIYTPTFPQELLDMHMIDDSFLQFGQSDFETDHFSLNPPHDDGNDDSFLLHLSNFHAEPTTESVLCNSLLAGISVAEEPTSNSAALIEGDDSDCFFKDELCLIAPGERQESFFDYVLGSTSTPATTSSSVANPLMWETTNVGRSHSQEDEEEEEETDDDRKPGALNCKNLVSERNRRKRLSQQLLSLRALVPNITKMDKRSVLVDALAYLKRIHEETARIQTELKERSSSSSSSFRYNHSSLQPPPLYQKNSETLVPSHTLAPLPPRKSSKVKAHILEIDAEKIEERRFVVKITCKGGAGVGAEVLRVIESLGFEITYTALEHIKPLHVLTTVFIRVRKRGQMTEEKLKDSITSAALKSGLKLQNP